MNKKLALVIHSLSNGGAERVAVNLANHWAADGRDVTIITIAGRDSDFYRPNPRVSRVALDLGYASGSVPSAILANWRRVRRLRAALRAIEPDLAIGFMPTANILLALASRGSPWRVFGSEHTYPPKLPLGPVWEFLRSRLYVWLDGLSVLTPETAEWVAKKTTAVRIKVIPNPVWPIAKQAPTVDPDAIVSSDARLLLAVGRLEQEKGFDLLVRAFSALVGKHPGWRLAIVGEGRERAALEGLIMSLSLEDNVQMPGVIGNVEDWYRRADIYVMSSRFEGFGNTLAEALACGTAAIAFDCAVGPGRILRDGVDGILVPAEDLPALTRALDRMMSDPDLRNGFSCNAVDAQARYAIHHVARQWDELMAVDERPATVVARNTQIKGR